MCALSWQVHNNQLTIVFDSGEVSPESNPEPLAFETGGNPETLISKETGNHRNGLAANEHGLVCFLLDNDRATSKAGSQNNHANRHEILRSVSMATDVFQIRRMLGEMDHSRFKPYQLVVFPDVFTPLQWQWDGKRLEEIIAPFPLITPALHPSFSEKLWLRRFRKETGDMLKPIPDDRHWNLHRNHRSALGTISGFIKHKNRINSGLIQIRVAPGLIDMAHESGEPVTNDQKYSQPANTRQKSDKNSPSLQTFHKLTLQRKTNPSLRREMTLPDAFSGDIIDIKNIFRDRSPALYQKFPGWIMELLRFIINEKTINDYLDKTRELPCSFLPHNALNHLGVRAKLKPGSGPLPESDTRPVFVANHPTGGLDGLLLLSWLSDYYPDIRAIVNDLLWHIPHIRPWVVPVDIYARGNKSVKTVMEAFEKDSPLLIYPAGQTARRIKGTLREAPWQKMPVKMALKYQRSMIPVHIDGHNSRLFNSVTWLRRKAGVNLNLELLFLPRALSNPACKEFGITVGPMLSSDQVRKLGKNDEERTNNLQQMCENLPASTNQETLL